MRFNTKLMHKGYHPTQTEFAPVMPPVYLTSTYVQKEPGAIGFDYTRANNPNFEHLEGLLASLENAKYATVFSSGLGALTALLSTLSYGDRIIILEGVYGGTYRLFTKVFQKLGVEPDFVSMSEFDDAIKKKAKFLFFETPTNPLLELIDIEKCSEKARKHGVLTIVDNTLATPYLQQPIYHGADIVLHSTTKYIGGHSDAIGGAVITNLETIKQQLDFARMSIGANPSPFDVWLIMRGLKTLGLRMKAHAENGMYIANWLQKCPAVKSIHYPEFYTGAQKQIAEKQMAGYSGVISAEFDIKAREIKHFSSQFKLFSLAESFGGIESLFCIPDLMTHASIPENIRRNIGISPQLLRFSVGIEDKEDLINDIESAVEATKTAYQNA